MKRLFDVFVSITAIMILLPVFIILWLVIRPSGKPVIFGHLREGRDGASFKCLKFRSMDVRAEQLLKDYLQSNPEAKKEWDNNFKLRNDPRITKIGSFIRKTSLDELPQFFNVLKGEMSLVGPRPVTKEELNDYYQDCMNDYYSIRPGLTGLWQISGRSDLTYEQRVQLDMKYIKERTFWGDIIILFKTPLSLITSKGAY